MKTISASRDLQGQDSVLHILNRFLESRTLPHAMLFTGKNGTGRMTAAYALARASFCVSPCNSSAPCEHCRRMIHGNHPDFHVFRPEKNILKIGQTHEMQRVAGLASSFAERKFIILKPADTLNIEAANTLLKTLEEPPPGSHFILITSHRDRILPTIRSRCLSIPFNPLPEKVIFQLLKTRIDTEDKTDSEMHHAALMGRGSLSESRKVLTEGNNQAQNLLKIISRLPLAAPGDIIKIAEQLGRQKESIHDSFRLILFFFRELAIHLSGAAGNLLIYTNEINSFLGLLKGLPSPTLVIDSCLDVMRYETFLDRNIQPRSILEILLLELREKFQPS